MKQQRSQFRAIRGVRDILPPESALWNRVEQTAHHVFATYDFQEIRLPIFEETELFARSVGSDTDIVSKEMYTFQDPLDLDQLVKAYAEGGPNPYKKAFGREGLKAALWEVMPEFQWLTLRPEATASVVRAYIEHSMHTLPGDVKLYYMGPMFRRERPQKGRYRQFYQIGAEVLGQSDSPAIDAEVIEMLMAYLDRLGLSGATLYVNSIGCKECRPAYVAKLREELLKVKDQLGADSQRRIETNPLRVLDSKLEHEQAIIERLPRIEYKISWRLVRGLDYYTRTTFEITAPGLGSQNAICGGGRYDGLVELLGGPPTKGIGFALGTDRFLLALKEAGAGAVAAGIDVFVAWFSFVTYPMAARLARGLRDAGFSVEMVHEDLKFKKSLGLADRMGARFVVLIGETEMAAGTCTVKRLADGTQQTVAETEIVNYLKSAGS